MRKLVLICLLLNGCGFLLRVVEKEVLRKTIHKELDDLTARWGDSKGRYVLQYDAIEVLIEMVLKKIEFSYSEDQRDDLTHRTARNIMVHCQYGNQK